ncbi:MAG TPA: hypothetical protein VJ694_04165 [Patescibacteria group bacterium]|nr:hypothetical protein [Patescibacteria group bacterium]
MRTFHLMILAALVILSMTGCPSNDPNCASSDGCGDDGTTPDGGNAGGPQEGNPSDAAYCADPATPMRCLNETASCRTATYECTRPAYACGDSMYTCYEFGDDYNAACCDGQLIVCPNQEGFYCPGSDSCVPWPTGDQTYEDACPSTTRCSYLAACNAGINT